MTTRSGPYQNLAAAGKLETRFIPPFRKEIQQFIKSKSGFWGLLFSMGGWVSIWVYCFRVQQVRTLEGIKTKFILGTELGTYRYWCLQGHITWD